MEAFAPDFSDLWLGQGPVGSTTPAKRVADDDPLPPAMKEALDALAERINAARSIV